jgi:hypothetical protein
MAQKGHAPVEIFKKNLGGNGAMTVAVIDHPATLTLEPMMCPNCKQNPGADVKVRLHRRVPAFLAPYLCSTLY